MLSSLINLLRIFVFLIVIAPIYLIKKERAIFLFLNFAGPSFIKLGQLLATRHDLIGEVLAKNLAKFQDKLKPFSQKKVQEILTQEFGDNLHKIFKDFATKSIASASIAQVHKATLINGQTVAVKILRPNIKKNIMRDIATLKLVAKISYFFSKFFAKSCDDIADLLQETAKYELDLLLEGANASRLREEMIETAGFYVPQIFWQYSSSKILLSEWIDGVAFSNQEAIKNSKFDKKIIAKNLVLSYFKQVYVNGFFHADMHPGNLFLMDNGNIAVVDFGIMGKINKKMRITVAEILIGFLNRDYNKIAKIHIESDLVPRATNLDDLALSCRKIGEMIVGNNVKDISISKLLTSLVEMSRSYKMQAKPELLLLQKTLLLVEGVGLSLDPDLNIWDLARPWVKEWAQDNIGFDAKIRDIILDIFQKIINITRPSPNPSP